ncbi:MAG: hypothetical protein EBU46_10165 [Nitrosomonadaceae bacterium]|nr:hypothetical protein [Nitrosomonadaceae bacterium]
MLTADSSSREDDAEKHKTQMNKTINETTSIVNTVRLNGKGQGNGGGWPSTTGNPSGGGRSNAGRK